MTFVDLEGLTTSEAEFMAKLREYENSDTWLLFVNYGFSMETARSLYDKGLIDTSKQMGMPAARLKRPMTAEEAAHECIEFSRTFGGLEKEEFRLNIARLRSLGYVVIPVTPSGETIERMRGATNNAFENITNSGQRETMRAAYAAIVGGEG